MLKKAIIFSMGVLLVFGGMAQTTESSINKTDESGETPLTKSIIDDEPRTFDQVIADGADLDVPNAAGDAPLMVAVKYGRVKMAEELLSRGVWPKIKDRKGYSPLYYAVQQKMHSTAGILIEKGVNVNSGEPIVQAIINKDIEMIGMLAEGKADLTPGLVKSAQESNMSLFKILISHGASAKGTDIFSIAMKSQQPEMAELALINGASEKEALKAALEAQNKDYIVMVLNNNGDANEVIEYAVDLNEPQFFRELLVKYKANPTQSLKTAYEHGKVDLLEIALDNKAKADVILEDVVEGGNQAIAELVYRYGADANQGLSIAARDQNIAMVRLAIENGGRVKNGDLIKMAVEEDNLLLSKLLIQNGAKTDKGNLVKTSVEKKNLELTRLLLENKGDPNEGIRFAVEKNLDELALLLLEFGADGAMKGLIEHASEEGSDGIVKKLLEKGASATNGLEAAIEENHVSTARILLEAGAVIHDPEFLYDLIRKNKRPMALLLLEKGAPFSYRTRKDESLLHIACENEQTKIAELLIEKGLDVNEADKDGDTPLHAAVRGGRDNIDLVKLLLDNGALINAKNKKDQTVLSRAKSKRVKKYLVSLGAKEE